MKQFGTSLAAGAALAFAGCATVPPSADGDHPLTRHDWQLIEIVHANAKPIKLTPSQQARHTLTFNQDGTASMMLDCNRGNADWSAADPVDGNGILTFSQVAATRALCPPPSYGEEMAAALPSAKGFTILPGGRSMTVITRRSVYAFVADDGMHGGGDALVPGTDYHATAQIVCSVTCGAPTLRCPAGVKRNWGEDGTTLVEITRPNGLKRAIFFRGTHAYGADSAQADGSAGWTFNASRRGDETVISYGPERYVIADAFVLGG